MRSVRAPRTLSSKGNREQGFVTTGSYPAILTPERGPLAPDIDRYESDMQRA